MQTRDYDILGGGTYSSRVFKEWAMALEKYCAKPSDWDVTFYLVDEEKKTMRAEYTFEGNPVGENCDSEIRLVLFFDCKKNSVRLSGTSFRIFDDTISTEETNYKGAPKKPYMAMTLSKLNKRFLNAVETKYKYYCKHLEKFN